MDIYRYPTLFPHLEKCIIRKMDESSLPVIEDFKVL
jgi:hypothetical protein